MNDIGLELRNLMNLIVRQTHKDINKTDVSMPHAGIIKYLIDNKDKNITAKDFETILMTRKSTLSRMLSLMETNGLIVRVDDLTDSRKKYIKLTNKSHDIHNHMINQFKTIEEKMIRNISEYDLSVFMNVINQMQRNLQEDEGIIND